jgi:hypothetical protein
MLIRSRKAQSIVDFAVAFIAVAGLIVGIVRVWIWFNANYAKRQVSFQSSRLVAAGTERPYDTKKVPVNIGGTSACPDCKYKPLDLTEDWVFKANASGNVALGEEGEEGFLKLEAGCDNTCTPECLGQPGCTGLDGGIEKSCVCYQECSVKCVCQGQTETMVGIYESQAISLNGQADSLESSADSMRDTADDCDDPWEICWWGTWGKTSGELNDAANELDYSAKQIRHSATKANEHAAGTKACCEETSEQLQSACLKEIEIDATCDQNCLTASQVFFDQCKANNPGLGQWLCPFKADIEYDICFKACIKDQSAACGERVNTATAALQSKIQSLNSIKETYLQTIENVDDTLSSCASTAAATCNSSCAEDPDPAACYDQCYEPERNNCCQQNCCQGGSWGRNCDSPSTNCDDSCTTTPCPKCGLSQAALNTNAKIQEIDAQISALQQKIQELPGCCDLESTSAQNNCIQSKYL